MFEEAEERAAERDARFRERELELEAKAREREDRREEQMMMMMTMMQQHLYQPHPFSYPTLQQRTQYPTPSVAYDPSQTSSSLSPPHAPEYCPIPRTD